MVAFPIRSRHCFVLERVHGVPAGDEFRLVPGTGLPRRGQALLNRAAHPTELDERLFDD